MSRLRRNSRKALAAFISVWLSGVVFLFCCDMTGSAAEFCPLARSGSSHCNRSKTDSGPQIVVEGGATELRGCPLLPAVFDKIRKVEREVQTAQPADIPAVEPYVFEAVSHRFADTSFYSPPQRVQHKIFIKHHVFRI